jgi:hypothetical protein
MPRIRAVGTSVPGFIATNDHVVSLALEASEKTYNGAITDLERQLKHFLLTAGARERRWRASRSKPIEHIVEAWENAQAKMERSEINYIGALIYCGIDRGVAEPSHGSLLAMKFGLRGVRTCDVSDACMGWFTASQIAVSLTSEEKPYCVIVSAEFPLEFPGKLYPQAFAIRDNDDLQWKGAALTLGEAASVTVIDTLHARVEDGHVIKSDNNAADICCAPLLRPDRFIDSARLLGKLDEECFVAHMPSMASASYRDSQIVLAAYIERYGIPSTVLPHLVSQSGPPHASKHLLNEGVLRNCFEWFGNLATSSIPVGYEYYACEIHPADHLAGWISAAGMSHCVFRIY